MEDKLILLVEDNPHIMAINDAALHMRGYRTLQAETAHKCRELLCFHAVDLIVLDILLPDGDGVALCREIKQEYDVPILFLTAMGENEDIVKGLTAGGDDYLTKPYDLEVFMARVEARLRAAHPKERAVRLGPLQMNLLSGRAYIGETDLNLTQKEFAALLYLARRPNRSVSAQELYEAVWQQPMGADPHAVRMTISRLKQKLGGEDASVTRGSKVVFTATPAVENGRNKQMVAQWTVNGVDRNNISNELVIPSLTGKTDVAVKFVPYEGFAIPTGGTGWKVSDVKRVPNDTQPTSKIRKNGELTFTVGLASDYTVISKLVINGYDCINGKLAKNATLHGCDAVEARKNANGSYTVTIKNVTAVPDMSVEAHRVIIGSLTVPEKFKNIPELDTVEKIQAKLTAELTGRKDGVAFYDIALKYYDGSEWIPVNENNFPAEGVDVVLPYPNGTDSKDTFQIVHMLTKTGSEGEIEKVDHTKEIDGLRFHVTRLSPFGVSWTKYTAPTPGGGGGGGGGAVAPTTYDIVIPSALANTVKADKTKAAAGDTVTLTAAGEGTLTVTDANGKTVALTDLGSGKYTFKMPSAKVSVGFKTIADQPCDGGKDCPSAPFTDVDTAKWYHLSVDYVLAHKMMNGVSSRAFAPNANLTRGMLVQILYNLEGKPKGTAANFSDVQADAWYAEAVGWAASDKVVTGYADGTFRPNAAVTREQTAAILYRYAQSKGIDVSVGENTNILSYVDVQQASEYAIPALQWAVGAGVLNGKNGGRLAPTGTATRAEIAAIMQRWCENIIK